MIRELWQLGDVELAREVGRRARLRANGRCPQCGRRVEEPVCEYADQHALAPRVDE